MAELQEARATEFRAEQKQVKRQQLVEEKRLKNERAEQAKLRSYEYVFKLLFLYDVQIVH